MKKRRHWKRNCIIAVWLISIFAITAVYYGIEKRSETGKARDNLVAQAEAVGGQRLYACSSTASRVTC